MQIFLSGIYLLLHSRTITNKPINQISIHIRKGSIPNTDWDSCLNTYVNVAVTNKNKKMVILLARLTRIFSQRILMLKASTQLEMDPIITKIEKIQMTSVTLSINLMAYQQQVIRTKNKFKRPVTQKIRFQAEWVNRIDVFPSITKAEISF